MSYEESLQRSFEMEKEDEANVNGLLDEGGGEGGGDGVA